MDLKLSIGFIASHYIVIFGTTLALFFTTCMILLIRSIGNKSEEGGVADLTAIEGAMRRVLQSQPVSIAAGSRAVAGESAGAGAGSTEIVVDGQTGDGAPVSSEELAARDARIAELNKDLEAARLALNASDGEDPAKIALKEQVLGLTSKLDELQARLAEYEIIEDDIADLSMFKDENIALKKEIEKLKAQGPAPAAATGFESLEAEAAAAAVSPDAPAVAASEPMKFEKVEKFELNPEDDVMKEFAAAVDGMLPSAPPPTPSSAPASSYELGSQAEIDAILSGQGHVAVPLDSVPAEATPEPVAAPAAAPVADAAVATSARSAADAGLDAFLTAEPKQESVESATDDDPLAGETDADKMLSEVETLASSDEASGDSLNDTLDTDKLLAEVDSLKKSAKTA